MPTSVGQNGQLEIDYNETVQLERNDDTEERNIHLENTIVEKNSIMIQDEVWREYEKFCENAMKEEQLGREIVQWERICEAVDNMAKRIQKKIANEKGTKEKKLEPRLQEQKLLTLQNALLDRKAKLIEDEEARREYDNFKNNALNDPKQMGTNSEIDQNNRIIKAVTCMDAKTVFKTVAATGSTIRFAKDKTLDLLINSQLLIHPRALGPMDRISRRNGKNGLPTNYNDLERMMTLTQNYTVTLGQKFEKEKEEEKARKCLEAQSLNSPCSEISAKAIEAWMETAKLDQPLHQMNQNIQNDLQANSIGSYEDYSKEIYECLKDYQMITLIEIENLKERIRSMTQADIFDRVLTSMTTLGEAFRMKTVLNDHVPEKTLDLAYKMTTHYLSQTGADTSNFIHTLAAWIEIVKLENTAFNTSQNDEEEYQIFKSTVMEVAILKLKEIDTTLSDAACEEIVKNCFKKYEIIKQGMEAYKRKEKTDYDMRILMPNKVKKEKRGRKNNANREKVSQNEEEHQKFKSTVIAVENLKIKEIDAKLSYAACEESVNNCFKKDENTKRGRDAYKSEEKTDHDMRSSKKMKGEQNSENRKSEVVDRIYKKYFVDYRNCCAENKDKAYFDRFLEDFFSDKMNDLIPKIERIGKIAKKEKLTITNPLVAYYHVQKHGKDSCIYFTKQHEWVIENMEEAYFTTEKNFIFEKSRRQLKTISQNASHVSWRYVEGNDDYWGFLKCSFDAFAAGNVLDHLTVASHYVKSRRLLKILSKA